MTYYSPTHEYACIKGEYAYIGITDYAQKALGNIVYVDMPEVDDEVEAGEDFGAVESVKAASDLISPLTGTVVEVNDALADNPRLLNADSVANWIIKIRMSDPKEVDNLLDEAGYATVCEAEKNH